MPSNIVLKAKGLHTFNNPLSEVPDGALKKAFNVVIDKDSIIEPRRGFKLYGDSMGNSSVTAKQIFNYKGRILRHYNNILQFDNGSGTFASFKKTATGDTSIGSNQIENLSSTANLLVGMELSGTGIPSNTTILAINDYSSITISNNATATNSGVMFTFNFSINEVSTGLRIKSIESNGNSYFTTSAGIKKISVANGTNASTLTSNLTSAPITNSGGIKALDFEARTTENEGFLVGDSVVAYRIVWGLKDSNNNLVLGSPSSKVIVYNSLLERLILSFNQLLSDLDTLSSLFPDLVSNSTGNVTVTSGEILYQNNLTINSPHVYTVQAGAKLIVNNNITLVPGSPGGVLEIQSGGEVSVETHNLSDTDYLDNYKLNKDSLATELFDNLSSLVLQLDNDLGGTTFQDITAPSAPSEPATTSELEALQEYLNEIIINLNTHSSISTAARESTIGDFEALAYYAQVALDITVPDEVTTSHIYQVYRTATTQSTGSTSLFGTPALDPGNEFQLVFEASPSASEIASKLIQTTDDIEDDFLGANLYTNPNSGEGILKANELPPLAKDIALFKNHTFFANTISKHRKNLQLITIPDTLNANVVSSGSVIINGEQEENSLTIQDTHTYTINSGAEYSIASSLSIAPGGTMTIASGATVEITDSAFGAITITDGIITNTYSFQTPTNETTLITTTDASSLNNKYFYINSAKNKNKFYIWYNVNNGGTDPAISNRIGIEIKVNTGASANDVATATKNQLNAKIDFTVSVVNNILTIVTTENGIVDDATDAGLTGFTISITNQGRGEDASNKQILLANDVNLSPSQQVDETARSLVRVINKQFGEIVNAFYLSGNELDSVPGQILLESRVTGGNAFYVLVDSENIGNSFNPPLLPSKLIDDIMAGSDTTITTANHGLVTGDSIVISGSNSTPSIDGIHEVTVLNANSFTIDFSTTNSGSTGGFSKTTSLESSDNDEAPNRIFYSKKDQPEAVPLINYINVGPKDKEILRILPLRDSLFILKEEGIYRLSSETEPFVVSLFDNSTNLKAPDSASVLNNLIYMYSDQGIATVSETGVEIVSRSIEDLMIKLQTAAFTNFLTVTHGIGYESDRSYYLYTLTNPSDNKPTQCFRYNTFTRTWSILDKVATCAVVNTSDDKLYIGATDTNFLEQERKTLDRTDYADREHLKTISPSSVNGNQITLDSISNVAIGDVIAQTQYLTVSQFNRLLKHLDSDSSVGDDDYYTSLHAIAGDELRDAVTKLAEKLDADSGVTATDYASSISAFTTSFQDTQLAFNVIINKLNSDTNSVTFINYKLSNTTALFEAVITDVDVVRRLITIKFPYDFIAGPLTIYKHFNCEIEWAPQFMGDPSVSKHIREGTIMFNNDPFSDASLGFASDLHPEFENIEFEGNGNGSFGNMVYGEGNFGGLGNSAPFRTLVPRNKQRCRYINSKFLHGVAREFFSIIGISHTYEITSSRAYK